VDDQVGQVLDALETSGLSDHTLVIYTSDHGDHLGDHELWWKSSMYEQSAGIPLILSGPGLGSGVVNTPVSLVDVSATIAKLSGWSPSRTRAAPRCFRFFTDKNRTNCSGSGLY
jgi:choline-sulfatase